MITVKDFAFVLNCFSFEHHEMSKDRLIGLLNQDKWWWQRWNYNHLQVLLDKMREANLIELKKSYGDYFVKPTNAPNLTGKTVNFENKTGEVVFQDNHKLYINCKIDGNLIQFVRFTFEVTYLHMSDISDLSDDLNNLEKQNKEMEQNLTVLQKEIQRLLTKLTAESDQLEATIIDSWKPLSIAKIHYVCSRMKAMFDSGNVDEIMVAQLAGYGLGKLLRETSILEQLNE
jgi:hypothetical protein